MQKLVMGWRIFLLLLTVALFVMGKIDSFYFSAFISGMLIAEIVRRLKRKNFI